MTAEPSERRATIVDVAKRAGVAISSASAAINGRPGVSAQTRERIQQAARELGFVPSLRGRSLSSKRAFAVGLVVDRDPEVFEADPFFGGFLGGLESVLSVRGSALVLQVSTGVQDDLERYRRLASDRRVDGVFLNELRVDDPRIALVRELGLPAVAITEDGIDFAPSVLQDNSAAIVGLVDAFVARGHRRFLHVSGPASYMHALRRQRIWTEALDARGIDDHTVIESDFTHAGGIAAADAVLDLPRDERPTAVFCGNDLMAAGFLVRAHDRGVRVPDEISIAGYDGTDLSTYLRPSLTTITTSPRTIGRVAAEVLLDAIDGVPVPAATVGAVPELIVRTSLGPAPDGDGSVDA